MAIGKGLFVLAPVAAAGALLSLAMPAFAGAPHAILRSRGDPAAASARLPPAVIPPPAATEPPTGTETQAKEAYIVEVETGTVLLAKNADARFPPASMSKMMTAYVVFSMLK
ncbi:MAG TPA: D-alanyl-D-alanine carboxypeptidase, partial [Stellaceae bacterium]|nr:D-alanyl-D-alanine carboxypeptidase [Stellaceae bacterium]